MAFSFEIKELVVDKSGRFVLTPPECVDREFFVNIDFGLERFLASRKSIARGDFVRIVAQTVSPRGIVGFA